jgi:hypothetical protein
MPMKSRLLLSPPGAGGSWLVHTIHQCPPQPSQPHFHIVWQDPELMKNVHHQGLDETIFNHPLVVFGGDSWFNMYLNLVYKIYHLTRRWLATRQQDFLIYKMINLVTAIREHEAYARDFVWEWLFYDWQRFHQCIAMFQQQHKSDIIDPVDFDSRRTQYIATCVNPVLIFEDWHNLYWICAVLGQAQYQKIQFDVAGLDRNQLRELAEQIYPRLDAIPCVNTKTQIVIPPAQHWI